MNELRPSKEEQSCEVLGKYTFMSPCEIFMNFRLRPIARQSAKRHTRAGGYPESPEQLPSSMDSRMHGNDELVPPTEVRDNAEYYLCDCYKSIFPSISSISSYQLSILSLNSYQYAGYLTTKNAS
jgi:hypothetical protein